MNADDIVARMGAAAVRRNMDQARLSDMIDQLEEFPRSGIASIFLGSVKRDDGKLETVWRVDDGFSPNRDPLDIAVPDMPAAQQFARRLFREQNASTVLDNFGRVGAEVTEAVVQAAAALAQPLIEIQRSIISALQTPAMQQLIADLGPDFAIPSEPQGEQYFEVIEDPDWDRVERRELALERKAAARKGWDGRNQARGTRCNGRRVEQAARATTRSSRSRRPRC